MVFACPREEKASGSSSVVEAPHNFEAVGERTIIFDDITRTRWIFCHGARQKTDVLNTHFLTIMLSKRTKYYF